jgi:hypothetical protein
MGFVVCYSISDFGLGLDRSKKSLILNHTQLRAIRLQIIRHFFKTWDFRIRIGLNLGNSVSHTKPLISGASRLTEVILGLFEYQLYPKQQF